jgi:cyclopropane fatty-acyl-phospholipid synthase-like methyltransferase
MVMRSVARSVAETYDEDTRDYLSHGIGLFVWFLLAETEPAHVERLVRYAGLSDHPAGLVVVDLGCGVGELLRLLHSTFPCNRYLGVTISSVQARAARARAPFARVDCADFNRWTMPTGVDLFVMVESLGHVHDLASFLGKCATSLNVGGRVLIQDVLSSNGLRSIPSWSYSVRQKAEVAECAVAAGLTVLDISEPVASSARAMQYWSESARVRQFHGPGVGAADRCVLYLLERASHA